MPDTAVQTASRLAGERRVSAAAALLTDAAAGGDAAAAAELAVWRLRGDLVPRDLAGARAALRQAVTIGHVDAALTEVALTANGTGGPADWRGAVRLLAEAATADPVAAGHLALVEAMRLDADGYPAQAGAGEVLCDDPAVTRFHRAVTPAECLHLAGIAHPHLEPGVVIDPATRRAVAHPVRTSFTATIGPAHETLPVAALTRRLAALTATPLANGEPLQVLRYAPGQQYRLHSDALPGVSNQRRVTAIIYLNDGFEGGETDFPLLDLSVCPRAGDVLVFRSLTDDGRVDARSRHAGTPVTAGVKWIATRWIRDGAFDPWAG